MALKILIETIKHKDQRYETVGDWFYDHMDECLIIRVSEMGNWKREVAVALHELWEASVCQARGITEHSVDVFDMNFKGDGEPGDDPKAPYHKEHQSATNAERMFVDELGMDWDEYNDAVDNVT